MKISRIGLICCLSLFSSFTLYSQTHNSYDPAPSMAGYSLVENTTYSYRAVNGVKTNTYDSMASFTTRSYTQGYLKSSYWIKNYRLMFPLQYNSTYSEGYPLLIMLHGAGERGNCASCCGGCYQEDQYWNIFDSRIPLADATGAKARFMNNDYNLNLGGQALKNAVFAANGKLPNDATLPSQSFPGFLLFPQMMNDYWTDSNINDVIIIVKLLIVKYNIDPNRIFVHGLSAGGAGTFALINKAPWLIAGALPIAAIDDNAIAESNQVDPIATIPLWQFQGAKDVTAKPSVTYANVKTFKNYGMDVTLTVYPNLSHSVWNEAWAEPNFFPWILSKNKANLFVRYQDPNICSTSGAPVELRSANGFLAYQWEKDGQVIQNPNSSPNIFMASVPGTYRARFSRLSANPTEAQWNRWSDPVIVRSSAPPAPVITPVGSTHYIDGVTGVKTVTLTGPSGYTYYHWYKDGAHQYTTNNDTVAFITAGGGQQGVFTLQGGDARNCISPSSPPVSVVTNDPQTLTTPSNVTGVVTSATSINLFWNDNSSNETGFEVYRALQTSTNYKLLALTSADAISFLDTGLKPDSTYKYILRTINNSARSSYTTPFTISTSHDAQPPTAPQNLKVITTTLTSSNAASITLAWDPSTDNSGIKEYVISWTRNDNLSPGSLTVAGNLTTATITGLSRNRGFTFSVIAHDIAPTPNSSAPSNLVYAETILKGLNYFMSEGAWTTLYADGTSTNNTTNVTWSKLENTGTAPVVSLAPRKQDDFFYLRFEGFLTIPVSGTYTFYLNAKTSAALYISGTNNGLPSSLYPNPVASPGSYTSNQVINGNQVVADNTIYTAVENSGTKNFSTAGVYPISVIYSEYSGPGETLVLSWAKTSGSGQFAKVEIPASAFISGGTTIPNLPAIPTGLAVNTPTLSTLSLAWNWAQGSTANNTGIATGYEIYRATSSAGPFNMIQQITPNTTKSFVDGNLNAGTTYYYKVKAIINGTGSSDYSTVASATTLTDGIAPSVPTGLTLQTQNYTDAAISWTASTDNVQVALYNIYSNGILIGSSTTNTYAATGLTSGSPYSFTVSAKDASGNESAQSAPVSFSTSSANTYYYDGSGPLANVTNWGTSLNGSGINPVNFTDNGQYFIIANTTSASLGGAWNVSGSVSKIIVNAGTTLTIDNTVVGKISAQDGATINVNYSAAPTFETLAPTSTVNFNIYSTIPQATYGNVNLNDSGTKILGGGTSIIAGNLTIASGVTLKGLPLNGSGIVLSGNLIAPGTHAAAPSDENIAVRMDGTTAAQITSGDELVLYQLTVAASKTVTFNNTSGSPVNIKVGSENGGGMTLENGSVFQISNNNLVLQFAATLNSGGQTGKLDITGGDIDFTSSASASALLNFGPVGKTVDYFNVNLTGSGASVTIGQPVTLTDGLKLKQGIFNANGNVILESTASTTASIRQIENGGVINGNVTVKRYAAAQGVVYRYISFPVAGVKVADLQSYVPINGNFSGTSGSGTATLYKYTTNWVQFPKSSNQETFDQGRGYSFLNQGGASPTLWQSTGVPYQGQITFSNLTGGSPASGTGWNLLGNPYASPIIWSNSSNWQVSGLGTTVYVRYNHDGVFDWQYWNTAANGGLGAGTLPGGKIPSGQAFWIQATNNSPSITIQESAKSPDNGSQNTSFYRESTSPAFGTFTFTLSGNGKSDPTFIYVTPTGADTFDKTSDSEKQINSYFNFSTLSSDSVKLAINQLSNSFSSSCLKTVGFNLDNTPPGQYTINSDVASWQGALLLHDNFLNTTSDISQGNSYSFTVTSDPRSYGKKRFSLLLNNPQLDVTSPTLASNVSAVCLGSPDATVISLKNSQQGVSYTVVDDSNNKVSNTITGNGAQLDFTVSQNNFKAGVNNFHAVAEWNGCSSSQLLSSVAITFSSTPSASITASATALCSGETEVLTASGALSNGSYRWYRIDQSTPVLLDSKTEFLHTTVQTDNRTTTYVVQAINQYGCESSMKGVSITSVALDVPTVSQSGNTFYSSSDHNNQWLKDGQPITGMTGISYQPIEPGVYSVRVAVNGCSRDSEPIDYLVNGIEHPVTSASYFAVYPNPTSQHNVQLRGNIYGTEENEVTIELIDTNGKVHLSTQFSIEAINNGVTLDMSSGNLSSGVYLVVMKLGAITTKKKVMIN